MTETNDHILAHSTDGVMTIRMNRPDKKNAITGDMYARMAAALDEANADDAVNYGGIGAVIGHEIGHGFDDSGSTFDGDGVLRNWWTDEDLAEFKVRTGALVEQYNQFKRRLRNLFTFLQLNKRS